MGDKIERVGVIGLGRMGSGMARNIQKAGFALTVYNRSAAKMDPFVAAGATPAASARDAAARADVVLSSLMDDQSVLDCVQGPDGILAGLERGGVHIGTTTVSPGCATRLAELHAAQGSHYVAAPVVGRPDAAAAAQLRTFVAGEPAAIARCEPVLRSYTQAVVNVGTRHAAANSLKLAVNFMIASVIELIGEVYAFGEKSGIDQQLLAGVMATFFPQPAVLGYAERIRERRFDEVGFALTAGLKDLLLIEQAATETRAPLPYASIVRDKLLAAIATGLGDKDWSAIYEVTRANAGLK